LLGAWSLSCETEGGHGVAKAAEKEFSLDAFRARARALYDAVLAPVRVAA